MSETTKLRSYHNSDGMLIELSQEHLDKAVDVKLELQDMSPSRRCSWSQHKKIMEQEGFFDSDINEAYRCLVKDYQKETGRLHSLVKHVDLVSTSKLEAIRNVVSDVRFEKQANQELLRKINPMYREMTRTAIYVEEFKNILLDEMDFSIPHYIYNPVLPSSKNVGIGIITDWHVGVKVSLDNNIYNLEVAKKRIAKLKQELLDYCKTFNVTNLYLIGLGDWIEHLYMRKNQSQDCEFGVNMQIAQVIKLVLDLIVSLSEYVNVIFGSIAGNHDRGDGDKEKSFDGDNANVVVMQALKDMIALLKTERIKLLDLEGHETEIILDINNKKIKFTHGHEDSGNPKHRMKAHISMDNEFYDAWVHGHLHNFYVQEDDHGRLVVGVGCLMGRNNYSKKMSCATDASQAIIIVKENGEILPMRIGLQIT